MVQIECLEIRRLATQLQKFPQDRGVQEQARLGNLSADRLHKVADSDSL